MITISCTSCKSTLEIDDAFAGGVCRCQHCGAIQTVPSHLRAGSGTPGASAKSPKTLYQNRSRHDSGAGTGLDDLADVVASSGISSGLSSRRERPAAAPTAVARKKQNMILFAGGGVVTLLLVGVIMLLTNRTEDAPSGSGQTIIGAGGQVVEIPSGASFASIPLSGNTVIYVLDRGGSTSDAFGNLTQATMKSIRSLGAERKFQIIFWSDDSPPITIPAMPSLANPANIELARRELADVFSFGQTDAKPALEKAMLERPDTIVIATGKGWDLDDSFAQMVQDVLGEHGVTVHAVSIGSVGSATGLKLAAERSGGQFRETSRGELAQFGQ